MEKIGWIGFGNMGKPMATNLQKNGYGVMVYVRQAAPSGDGIPPGFIFTNSLSELVAHSSFIFLMLPNDQACEEILKELVALNTEGNLIVNMSTISPDASVRLGSLLDKNGVRYVEAPVSGSIKPAQEGNLVILAAGSYEEVQGLQNIFDILGKKTIYLEAIGNAARAKIGINYYMSVVVYGLADTLLFMEKLGVGNEQMVDIINSGACSSGMTQIKGSAVLQENYQPAFPLKYMAKDLRLAQDVGINSALSSLMTQSYNNANSEFGEEDMIAILKYLKEQIR